MSWRITTESRVKKRPAMAWVTIFWPFWRRSGLAAAVEMVKAP